MRCSKARRLISQYIDGELTAGDKREFDDHVRGCEGCRSDLEANRGLRQLFESTENFKAPLGFHSKVMANVNGASKHGWSPKISIPVRLAEAAMVFLLIVVGIISGNFLARGFMPEKAEYGIASLHLDAFHSTPPGSLGGAYITMTEANHEE